MIDNTSARKILPVFAQYGFKKTSMEDIARAAGLSRQSIYNRFGSKDAVFEWAVATFITDMLQDVTDILNSAGADPLVLLAKVYDVWVGSQFPLWCGTSHGAEIMDLSIVVANRSSLDLEGGFAKVVSRFLLDRSLASAPATADNKAFVLSLASKGLLSEAKSAEVFSREMMRVISTTVG